jgi:hypothetical protein
MMVAPPPPPRIARGVPGFNQQARQENNWSWVAVAASIAAYFQPNGPWIQCAIAANVLNQPCCLNPRPAACNANGPLALAMEVAGVLTESIAGAPPFERIWNEMENEKPIGVEIAVPGAGSRAVTIRGCDVLAPAGGEPRLLIANPWPQGQSGWFRFEEFPANFGPGGNWQTTGFC